VVDYTVVEVVGSTLGHFRTPVSRMRVAAQGNGTLTRQGTPALPTRMWTQVEPGRQVGPGRQVELGNSPGAAADR